MRLSIVAAVLRCLSSQCSISDSAVSGAWSRTQSAELPLRCDPAGLRSHFRNAKLAALLYLISDYVSLLTEKDEVRVECCRASSLLELSHWPVTCVGGRLCIRDKSRRAGKINLDTAFSGCWSSSNSR